MPPKKQKIPSLLCHFLLIYILPPNNIFPLNVLSGQESLSEIYGYSNKKDGVSTSLTTAQQTTKFTPFSKIWYVLPLVPQRMYQYDQSWDLPPLEFQCIPSHAPQQQYPFQAYCSCAQTSSMFVLSAKEIKVYDGLVAVEMFCG